MLYIIGYDIKNDKRRRIISKILGGYGIRVQFSVFQIDVDIKDITWIKKEIRKTINDEEDSVVFYHICKNCEKFIEILGKKLEEEDDNLIIF